MKVSCFILHKFKGQICKMKIAFLVVNLGCGGVERTVTYLSDFFAKHGEDVSIVCISDEQFYDISPDVDLVRLDIPSECNGILDRIRKIILRYIKIYQSMKRIKPDCLMCLDAEMIRYVYWQHKFGHFKLVTSERNNPLVDSEKKKKLKYKSFRNSDGIVFQTQRAQECFPDDIAKKGIVIPNAVGNEYVFKSPKTDVRRKVITAAGRLTEQKDYPTLFKAFARFINVHPDYRLEIYGKGEDLDSLKDLACKLCIDSLVDFKGAVKDAITPIASSSCYVMSSLYEGMPNALMEAMAVGVPCVSTDCPFGPRELIEDGENGVLVPVGNTQALAEAIIRMVEEKDFAESCGNSARSILEKQSIDRVSRLYLDYVYQITHKQL